MLELSAVSTRTTARIRSCAPSISSVAAGEVVALIGANAAGKSTTMRLIAGLKRATSGSIRLDGIEIEAAVDATAGSGSASPWCPRAARFSRSPPCSKI